MYRPSINEQTFAAFPVHLTPPRLTTAEAIDRALAEAARAAAGNTVRLVSAEITARGDFPRREYSIRFVHEGGRVEMFAPHGAR